METTVVSLYEGWMSVFISLSVKSNPIVSAQIPRTRGIYRCSDSLPGLFADFVEELVVGAEGAQPVDEQFEAWGGVAICGQAAEDSAQLPHHLQLLAVEQQLLVAGAGGVDVDRRVDAPLGELAIQPQLHVAGALELFEDRVVHAAVRLDERGGEDRQRAALFDVARRAEELLRRIQGSGVDAAGQDATARWGGEVV